MATYHVYDNILIKLENVFLRVENEVDMEINSLLKEQSALEQYLKDLKGKVEVLSALKRSFELYFDSPSELQTLYRSLFKIICDKQVRLRFLQEKELLLSSYLVTIPEQSLPSVILLNKELKVRKQLQQIELLASFLIDDLRFSAFAHEVEKFNEIFDLGVESGAMDKLNNVIQLFQTFFEKIVNIYDLDKSFIENLKEFRTQIQLQANFISIFTPKDIETFSSLQKSYRIVRDERIGLESEVDKLLYQFSMLKNGKKIIASENKHANGELESVLFKEYAIKQKIRELRQYKVDLNNQKDSFMKDPSLDGYAQAMQQLEFVEYRFRRLMMHKNFEKPSLASRFTIANKLKIERQFHFKEQTAYNKVLFQVLHNSHISSDDKRIILRLSKPSKLINADTGKFFYQRTSKTRSLETLESNFKKLETHELH